MPRYIAHLGSFPQLAWEEVRAVSPNSDIFLITEQAASVELVDDEAARSLMRILGGTVKISRVLAVNPEITPEALAQIMGEAEGGKKIQFGFAEVGRDHLPKIEAQSIKNELQKLGHSSRFVEGSRSGLSAAVLIHQKQVIEFNLINTNDDIFFTRTVAIQNIDHWTTKDRGKPYADRKKGMLPPKVALMMLNLGIQTQATESLTVFDPFCGTGTVLIEALDRGVLHLIASDTDKDSVVGTRNNLNWAKSILPGKDGAETKVYESEAAHVSALQLTNINLIVTEPFLGKQTPKAELLPDIFKGLEKLYIGAFKDWTRVLADKARIVMVFPVPAEEMMTRGWKQSWQPLIDKLTSLGYTTTSEPLMYARPGAVIKRQIYQFEFTKK